MLSDFSSDGFEIIDATFISLDVILRNEVNTSRLVAVVSRFLLRTWNQNYLEDKQFRDSKHFLILSFKMKQ
jgi:hypothetical protein